MNLDAIPTWAFFVGTIAIVLGSIEAGYWLGKLSGKRTEVEKEASVSGVAGAILALTALILAFTFGIVGERYDARKALVREDATTLRTAYLRAAFVPEPDRTESRRLLRRYLDLRVAFAQSGKAGDIAPVRDESDRIQRRLWDIAVANAERDMNSDVAALYIESLNDVFTVDALRMAVGVQARIPLGVWCVLYALTIFGMLSVGYVAGIAGSRRSKSTVILAFAYALVIVVIVSLDRPAERPVTQQPLVDLQRFLGP
jgi:hypothetical protein